MMSSDESDDLFDFPIQSIPYPIYNQHPTSPKVQPTQQAYAMPTTMMTPTYQPYYPSQPPFYVQTTIMPPQQPSFMSAPQKKQRKQEKDPNFLSRGERYFILDAFNKEQLMVMRFAGRRVIGSSKNQLVQSAVDITATRDDVINLILSAYCGDDN